MTRTAAIAALMCFTVVPMPAFCGDEEPERPFVSGGIYDKPFIASVGGARFGGYVDARFQYTRADGITDEATFKLERFNLFTFAPVSSRVRLAAELEFEDGGEEIKLELAIVDVELHTLLSFRAGMLLSPVGRFNLAHDSPANELTDRPLVSTDIIGVTLSEPGMGLYGAVFPGEKQRVTYELYLVNGYNDGVIDGTGADEEPGGTFIPAGRANFEDNNNYPSFVGRVAWSPATIVEVGVSAHTGPYNTWKLGGESIDERRDLSIFALDWEGVWRRFRLAGEWARASIDIPASLAGVNQETQDGYYIEAGVTFLENRLPAFASSMFAGTVRWDDVDFDADADGDDQRRLTLGVNFRMDSDTVIKLDYQYNWLRDAFLNESRAAGIRFSVASYF